MKKIIFLIYLFNVAAFALPTTSKSLLVYSARYAFQGEGAGLIPASEKVADYLGMLQKGTAFVAKKYTCDVVADKSAFGVGSTIVQLYMLYDVSRCTVK